MNLYTTEFIVLGKHGEILEQVEIVSQLGTIPTRKMERYMLELWDSLPYNNFDYDIDIYD